jgi:hypothetical protein
MKTNALLLVRRRTDHAESQGDHLRMTQPHQIAASSEAREILKEQKAEFTNEGAPPPGVTGSEISQAAQPAIAPVAIQQRRRVLSLRKRTTPT